MAVYNDTNIREMSLQDHIRNKTGMYVRSPDTLDCDVQIFKEIFDNSADECIVDINKMYNVKVVVFHKGQRYQMLIVDNGRGIPCGKLQDVYTKQFTSGKYDDSYGGITTGTFGIGSKTTVALSDRFIAMSKRNDGFGFFDSSKGQILDYKVIRPLNKDASTVGTTVFYEPDQSILKMASQFMSNEKGYPNFLSLVELISVFRPNLIAEVSLVNSLVTDSFLKKDPVELWEYFQNIQGQLVYKTDKNISPMEYTRRRLNISSPIIHQITLKKEIDEESNDRCGYDIGLALLADIKQSAYIGAVNYNIINGYENSHIYCLFDVIKEMILPHFSDDNEELVHFFKTSYRMPLSGYIMAKFKNASFEGQTKDGFRDKIFEQIYLKNLKKDLEKIPYDTWASIYNLIAEDVMDKFIKASNRDLKISKNLKNAAFSMNKFGSYIPCKIEDNTISELFITEGNSAGGQLKEVRDPLYQAILQLQGKPINAIGAYAPDLRANLIYQDLVKIIGVSPHDKDLSNMNFSKIGIMADADADGYHITALVIAILYKINPLIVESGRVFIANPPLYVLYNKNSSVFLRDQKALEDKRIDIYREYLTIYLSNSITKTKVKLDVAPFRDFCYMIKYIGTLINNTAVSLVINPILLESLIHVIDYLDPNKMNLGAVKKVLGATDIIYNQDSNSLILVDKITEISIPLARFVQEVKSTILPELNKIHWDKLLFTVTTNHSNALQDTPMSIMQIFETFRSLDMICKITRLKGLGECSALQLKQTCIDPSTRTFTTITSIGNLDRVYDMLGADTSARKELVKKEIDDLEMGV